MIAAAMTIALSNMTLASESRCSDREISAIYMQMQGYAQHPPPPAQAATRAIDISTAQSDAEQERTILLAVCPQRDFGPLASRLLAIEAWGDLLLAQLGAPVYSGQVCLSAANKETAAGTASAWFRLANATTASTPPDKLVATLTPQVQAQAARIGLALPIFSDATSYWEQQQDNAAKQALAACPSPSPSP
jgi:hypothetical protein